jgi:hypothetical protein
VIRLMIECRMFQCKSQLKNKIMGMIKRKDGSYSKRGLWDNIRANKGSGKKPTAEMLKQEKKIKNENKMGGMKKMYGGTKKKMMQKGGVSSPGELKTRQDTVNRINVLEKEQQGLTNQRLTSGVFGGVPLIASPNPHRDAQLKGTINEQRKLQGKAPFKKKMGGAKPDYLDMDKDGNKTESMKSAVSSKKKMAKGGVKTTKPASRKVKKMMGGSKKMYEQGGFLDAPSSVDLDKLGLS